MVDALQQAWRVLASHGTLLDLRPVSATCPIAVVTAEQEVQVGEVDAFGAAPEDAAANRAIRVVVEDGWFVPLHEVRFEFEFYWDTVAEMASFVEESRRMRHVTPAYADLEKARRDVGATARGRARLRCRRPMLLAAHRKGDRRPTR